MATGRMLKKNISKSEKFARVKTDKARMIYLMILPHLDKEGRMDANPKLIKGQVLPLINISPNIIQSCLEELNNAGLLTLYSIDNSQFLEYTRFGDFQTLRDDREAESEIPSIPAELQRNSSGTPAELPLKLSKVKLSKVKESKVNVKGFIPPTFEEVKKYITENPELANVNPETFFKGFNDSGWIDTQGKPVRNWKLKLRTWSSFGWQNTKPQKSAQQREEENIQTKRKYEQAQAEMMKRFEERSGKKIEMKKVEQPTTEAEKAQNKQKILNQLSEKG